MKEYLDANLTRTSVLDIEGKRSSSDSSSGSNSNRNKRNRRRKAQPARVSLRKLLRFLKTNGDTSFASSRLDFAVKDETPR